MSAFSSKPVKQLWVCVILGAFSLFAAPMARASYTCHEFPRTGSVTATGPGGTSNVSNAPLIWVKKCIEDGGVSGDANRLGGGGDTFTGNSSTDDSKPAVASCPVAGNPIVLATGNKIEPETDFASTGEAPLSLTRTYNKNWGGVGLFGLNWISNLDYKITFGSERVNACYPKPGGGTCLIGSNTVVYAHRPDARTIKFIKAADGVFYEDKASPIAKIVAQSDGMFVLYSEDGDIERYTQYGYVSQVLDEHSVGWTFTYNGTYPSRVTHTSGRFIAFTWANGQLTTVQDPAGNLYGYSYRSGVNMLVAVSKPGTPASTITYFYENTTFPNALTGKSFSGVRYSWFTYDSGGRATSTEHGGGKDRVSVTYSAGANGEFIATETNPLGKQTAYGFLNNKQSSVSAYASAHCGAAYRDFSYDVNGYKDLVTDFNGNFINYDYNAKGQLLKQVDGYGTADARTTTYVWDANVNRVVSITVAGLNRTSFTYTPDNRIASISVANLSTHGVLNQAHTTLYTYATFPNGMLSKLTVDGPLAGTGDAITTSYSTAGDVISVTNGLGTIAYSNYSGLGLPGKVTGLNGDITDYSYDAQGRVINVRTYPNGVAADTTYAYDAQGLLASLKTADGVITYYDYDSARRLLDTYRAANGTAGSETSREMQLFIYDLMGDVTKVENQELPGHWETQCFKTIMIEGMPECTDERDIWVVGTPTTTQTAFIDYDELGRIRAARGNNGQNFRYTYDDNGNRATKTDSLNRVTSFTYDALDRVATSRDAKAGVTSFTYDANDRLTSVTDPRQLVTSYIYDGFGQLWAQSSQDSGVTQYQYSATGLRTSMTRASLDVTSFGYDSLGRISSVAAGTQTQRFTYDTCPNGLGLLCVVADPTGSVNYSYSDQGKVASQRSAYPAGVNVGFDYSYDSMGHMVGITYPGVTVGYEYANGKVTKVTATINGVAHPIASYINYEPYGGMSGWTYGNGLNRGFDYDADGRLIGISTGNSNSVEQSLTYAFNANNLVTKITNGVNSGVTQSYVYDELSRLQSFSTGYGDTLNHTFDADGNRTRVDWIKAGTTTTTNYTIDPGSNRVVALSGGASRDYTYDDNGNPISISGLNDTYKYDPFNRMSSVTSSGTTTLYSVNALGQRVYKYAPGVAQYWFAYSPNGNLLGDYKTGGQGWTSYIRLGREVIAFVRSGQIYYVSSDHLARPEVVTNSAATAVWRANNYPFNRSYPLNQIGELNIGFPGQFYDVETGHWNNGSRDYDDDTGRYLQSDPIGLGGGLNTYAYVAANPTNNVDPKGEGLLAAGICEVGNAIYNGYQLYQAMHQPRIDQLKARLNQLAKEKKSCSSDDEAKQEQLDDEINQAGQDLMQAELAFAKSNANYTLSNAVQGAGAAAVCIAALAIPEP